MTLPRSYLTSTKNLSPILDALRTAQAPETFTLKFLETLDFKSSSDRLIIGVLKSLGFLNSDGRPTERYFRFLDQTQSAAVLAEGVRDAYSDLFQVNTNAQTLSQSEVINKFKTLGQGQISESVLEKMALTFSALCKLADFKAPPSQAPQIQEDSIAAPVTTTSVAGAQGNSQLSLGGLHYNIQLILPESRDPKVFDAIFRSLREHLI
jgi:hypothetical protein